jgi:lipopolysaccharide export system ATP-binding protein|tara:strand:- start:139 stop:873 length:735 start_codon:yes stop_codon:yes gene_type:complete
MILTAKNISKSYRGRKVVNSISVDVKQGEIVGLLGPNGAGKTTSFYMIVGIIKPENGDIFLNQEVISKYPMYQRAQKGIGYLAQEESVFRKLSVEDNILGVLEFSELTKIQQKEKAEQLMEEFGLINIRKNRGDLLSGGERRRTEIARALANNPKFLLLDEPFAGVDPIAVEDIQSIISVLKRKNIGILITDHNVQETLAITDRTYLMFEGKILKEGIPEDLAKDEMVRKVYLGKNFEFKRKKI